MYTAVSHERTYTFEDKTPIYELRTDSVSSLLARGTSTCEQRGHVLHRSQLSQYTDRTVGTNNRIGRYGCGEPLLYGKVQASAIRLQLPCVLFVLYGRSSPLSRPVSAHNHASLSRLATTALRCSEYRVVSRACCSPPVRFGTVGRGLAVVHGMHPVVQRYAKQQDKSPQGAPRVPTQHPKRCTTTSAGKEDTTITSYYHLTQRAREASDETRMQRKPQYRPDGCAHARALLGAIRECVWSVRLPRVSNSSAVCLARHCRGGGGGTQ